jgi:hypothetical protein
MVAKGLASMFERKSHDRGKRVLGRREVKREAAS